MALVNTLAVRLESITGAFTAGMNKASKDLAGFINQNKSVGQVVRNLNAQLLKTNPILGATAIAATATGGALAAATVIGARYADSINAAAKRTGFATDELSRLKFIAEQTDASFEDLANGLKFLTKNLGEAQSGNKAATKAFSDLGVKIDDANGAARSSEAVFNDVRTALAGIDNDARRAALATAIFGRGAFGILPFLRLTGQEIDALGKRAENLGLIVSEDFAKQGDAFGDNLSTIKAAGLGLNNIIAQRLLPGINAFLERFIEGAERVIPKFREAFDRVVDALESYQRAITPITTGLLPAFNLALEVLGDLFDQFVTDIFRAASIMDKFTAAIQLAIAHIVRLDATLQGNRADVEAIDADIEKLTERLQRSLPEFIALATAFDDVTGASSSTASAIQKVGEEVDRTKQKVVELNALQEEALFRIERPERPTAEARTIPGVAPPLETQPVPELDTGFEDLEEKGIAFTDILGNIRTIGESTFQTLSNFAGGLGDALIETAFGAKRAFGDFFKSLLKQIAAAIAKALVLQTILGFLPGGAGGFFGGFRRLLGGGGSPPAETPGLDSLLQSEGARFGLLFGRGLRSTFGQTAFAGISANPGTAQVVIEPQIVVQNAGPLARVEWFEKGQQQRLKRREEELGGLSR